SSFMSYQPTAEDVLDADRETARRQDAERVAGVREQISLERAAHDRRKFLPKLSDSTARGIEAALLHRCCPDRYAVTPGAPRPGHAPLREIALDLLTMGGYAPAPDQHPLPLS